MPALGGPTQGPAPRPKPQRIPRTPVKPGLVAGDRPTKGEARTSRPPSPTQTAIAGRDRPYPQDMRRADRYKQTQAYVNDYQNARNISERGGKGFKRNIFSKTLHGADAVRADDYEAGPLAITTRIGYQPLHPRPDPQRPANPLLSAAMRRLLDPPPPGTKFDQKSIPGNANAMEWQDPKIDEPRTDAEVRHFLKTGEHPLRVMDVEKAVRESTKPIGSSLAAPALFALKQSARGGHAVIGGLEGKNVAHEFLHGHDTGSDLLKKHGVHGLLASAGGLVLDYYAFGGPAKFTTRSVATKLEEAGQRAGARGNWEKGVENLAKAKSAPTNRGLGVGLTAGIPFTSKRFEATIGEKTTSAAARKLHIPQGAERLRNTSGVQILGQAAVPHFRPTDQPKDFHEKDTNALRRKMHKDTEAQQYAVRRGHAMERQVPEGDNKAFVQAIEHDTKEPIPVRRGTRVPAEHRRVTALNRQHRSLQLREQRIQGRVDEITPKASSRLVGDIIEKLTGSRVLHRTEEDATTLDPIIAAGGTRGEMAHAVKEYRQARSLRIQTGHELSDAKKAFRNAHTGAPSLYTDAERAARIDRLASATAANQHAAARLKAAEDTIQTTATRHAIRTPKTAGGRATPASQLAGYDRQTQARLNQLEQIRHQKAGVKSELDAARQAAAQVPPRERVALDARTGQPIHEAIAQAEKHSPADLPAHLQDAAAKHTEEMAGIKSRLVKAGLMSESDSIEHYLAHMEPLPAKGARGFFRKGGKGRNPGLLQHREDPRGIFSQQAIRDRANEGKSAKAAKKSPQFETRYPTIHARYVDKALRKLNDAEYLKSLADNGKPVGAATIHMLHDGETIAQVTPRGVKHFMDKNGDLNVPEIQKVMQTEPDTLRVLPKSVVTRESQARGGTVNDEATRAIGSWWNKATGAWKSAVTVYNMPFYQERNLVDDSFRSWLADTDSRSYLKSLGMVVSLAKEHYSEARALTPKVASREVFVGTHVPGADRRGFMGQHEFLREAVAHGVGQGYYGGELLGLLGQEVRHGVLNPTRKLTQLSAASEMVPRLATFLGALRRGMTYDQAAKWVRLHHFAYDELTPIERKIRGFIPFYTFTSRNFQLQFRKALTRPGRYATIEAFREEAAKLAGLPPGWDQKLSETDQRSLPIPVRFGGDVKALMMPLSITDLNRLPIPTPGNPGVSGVSGQQLDLFLQMVHPAIKAATEWGLNESFFFRSPIRQTKQHPEVPAFVAAPDWVGSLRKHLPFEVRTNYSGPGTHGKTVKAAWPKWVDYWVRQLPQSGFLATLSTTSLNSRDQSAGERLFGQLTGVRVKGLKAAEGAGLQGRIFDRLAEIKLEKANMPQRQKTADGFFYSKRYQALVDEEAQLQKQLDTLNGNPPQAQSLTRRPLTPTQQLQKTVQQSKQYDPTKELQKLIDRQKAKQKIVNAGG